MKNLSFVTRNNILLRIRKIALKYYENHQTIDIGQNVSLNIRTTLRQAQWPMALTIK